MRRRGLFSGILALAAAALLTGATRPKEPDWSEAIGRELVIEVEKQEYETNGEKREGSQVSFLGFWSLGNKEVANVPKDAATPGMKQLAKAGGNGNGNGAGVVIPPPPVAAAGNGSRSKYADL